MFKKKEKCSSLAGRIMLEYLRGEKEIKKEETESYE